MSTRATPARGSCELRHVDLAADDGDLVALVGRRDRADRADDAVELGACTGSGSRSGRSMKWIWPSGCPFSTRSPDVDERLPEPRLGRERVVLLVGRAHDHRRLEPELLARLDLASPARRRWRSTFASPLCDDPVRRRESPARRRRARSRRRPSPDAPPRRRGARCRRRRCRRSGSRVFHVSIAVDHRRGAARRRRPSASPTTAGRSSRGRRCACRRRPRPAGTGSALMKSASCSSGGPSGEPGNERLRFAPDGQSRVYACDASGEAHGITISWPGTSAGSVSRASRSAATWPSGSSPCTPPKTSAIGPSPPLIDTIGTNRCDQPLVFVDRGTSRRPNCLPGSVEVDRAVHRRCRPRRAIVDNFVYS